MVMVLLVSKSQLAENMYPITAFSAFDAVGWAAGRAFGL